MKVCGRFCSSAGAMMMKKLTLIESQLSSRTLVAVALTISPATSKLSWSPT